jgi:transposase
MNANLIFKWLKDARYGPAAVVSEAPVFLPVEISPETSAGAPLSEAGRIGSCGGALGRLEIILSGGVCLKVEGGFDGVELARLVRGLIG